MEKNDIVYIDYDLWIKEDNRLYETTKEDMAKEHDIYEASEKYGPRAIILGREQVFSELEDSILKAEVGKEYEVEIPPEKAFGKRDANLVQLLPLSKIIRLDITPDVGKEVEIDGKKGIITFVSASRVRIDFNHPLAGKSLVYKYTITKKVEGVKDRIMAIIDSYYGKGDEFKVKTGKTLTITLPDICKYDHRWHEMKYVIIADIREIIEPEKIVFLEEYAGKKKEKKEEGKKDTEKEEQKPESAEETEKEESAEPSEDKKE